MDNKDGHGNNSFTKLLKNIVDVNEKRVVAMKELSNLQDFIYTKNSLAKIHDFEFEEDSAEDLRDQHAILTLISMRNKLNLSLRRIYIKNQKENNNLYIQPFYRIINKSQDLRDKKKRKGNKHYLNNYNNRNKLNKHFNRDIKDEETESYDITAKSGEDDIDNEDLGKMHTKADTNASKENETNKNDDYEHRNNHPNFRRSWCKGCDKKASKVCRRACVTAHKNGCMIYKCSRRAKKAFSKECKRSCNTMFMTGKYSDSEWE